MSVKKMIDSMGEERKAREAWIPSGEAGWVIGGAVKSITVYAEYGDQAPMPYLCIKFKNGEEIRAAAKHYEITLMAEEE